MNAFDKRASMNDLRPMQAIYPVESVTGSVASRNKRLVVTSPPYRSENSKAWVVATDDGSRLFLDDNNVKDTGSEYKEQYNFHAVFLSKEDADAYVEYINKGELSKELTGVRQRLVADRQKQRELEDDNW